MQNSFLIGIYLQNEQDHLQQSISQQSVAPRINAPISDSLHYHASDPAMPCAFSSFTSMRPVNNVHHTEGANLHSMAYHLPPPHPTMSNQFSYVQPLRREAPPPSYSNGSAYCHFYNDQDRMRSEPHDFGESWRHSSHSFPGKVNSIMFLYFSKFFTFGSLLFVKQLSRPS